MGHTYEGGDDRLVDDAYDIGANGKVQTPMSAGAEEALDAITGGKL